MKSDSSELVKRIARLAKLNKELMEENHRLSKENEALNETLEEQRENLPAPEQKEIEEKPIQIESQGELVKFKIATVLYAGLHSTTKISDEGDSQKLLDKLDDFFYEFDKIVEKYNIKKIKSIGDTFIAVGGIPEKNSTNPVEVILASMEMKNFFNQFKSQDGNSKWDMRFGIHSGMVIANLFGKRKVNYDIKGDTVNIASRMEGWSDIGKITTSAMTYELIKEFFACEYYGKMPVRYQGNLQMFTVKGILPELSINGEGLEPNEEFHTRFSLVRFGDIQEFMLDLLEKELPDFLYYHNVKHTVDVVTQVELIGWGEGISDKEILLLKTAALFHDAGHTISYDEHEHYGTVLARKYLPKFSYTSQQIDDICELIMSTKLPPQPKSKLQSIMCDADLDYLGRSDMIPVSGNLYKELKKQDKIDSLNEWNKLQLKFISNHQYFTKTAQNLREVNKQKQIERLKKLIIW